MRKTLFTLAGLLVTIIANAYTCVTFNSGDPSILLKEAYISYEFDWDHARVTNHDNLLWNDYLRKRGDDFVKDWPKDRKKVEEYFTIRFNKKSDFLQIKDKSPVYKMIVRPKTIDVGNGGSAFNPWASSKAGGCIINGTIDFYDAATNQLLCVLNIVEAKDGGSRRHLGLCGRRSGKRQSEGYPDCRTGCCCRHGYSCRNHSQEGC